MDAFAGEGVEIDGEGGDEGFTFTGGHFGDFAAMEDNTADELDVVVDHVPGNHVAAGHPVVEVDGFVVAVAAGDDVDVVASDGEFAVVVGGGYDDFGVLGEAAGGFLDHAEGFGEDVVEDFLGFLVRVFFECL